MENQIVVLITVPSREVGKTIAYSLVEKRLAACVNILPGMTSIYTWEKAVQEEEEVLLVVKTRAEIFEEEFIPAVKAIHPYDVPEIIALPIVKGWKPYLDWIMESTR
ncbi:MAG: divalent-cation tolerance protein CutA [Chloroflexi bacterium]|nr:MAG: divalent-cation tolerance protein CutA [Chloroflexota bacterium]